MLSECDFFRYQFLYHFERLSNTHVVQWHFEIWKQVFTFDWIWRHGGHVGGKNNSENSTLLLCKTRATFFYCFGTNMAVLSREFHHFEIWKQVFTFDCIWRHSGHVGGKNNSKNFTLLQCKTRATFFYCFGTNMAVLSRECHYFEIWKQFFTFDCIWRHGGDVCEKNNSENLTLFLCKTRATFFYYFGTNMAVLTRECHHFEIWKQVFIFDCISRHGSRVGEKNKSENLTLLLCKTRAKFFYCFGTNMAVLSRECHHFEIWKQVFTFDCIWRQSGHDGGKNNSKNLTLLLCKTRATFFYCFGTNMAVLSRECHHFEIWKQVFTFDCIWCHSGHVGGKHNSENLTLLLCKTRAAFSYCFGTNMAILSRECHHFEIWKQVFTFDCIWRRGGHVGEKHNSENLTLLQCKTRTTFFYCFGTNMAVLSRECHHFEIWKQVFTFDCIWRHSGHVRGKNNSKNLTLLQCKTRATFFYCFGTNMAVLSRESHHFEIWKQEDLR